MAPGNGPWLMREIIKMPCEQYPENDPLTGRYSG
jgi:hypothetical protein